MRNLSMLALVLGLVACRGGGNSGDDTGGTDGNTNTDDVTIQQIQDPAMPACDPATPSTCVELKIKGVVVTAIDAYGAKTGDFWVQEPSGGPFSGVHVYGAPIDQVAALAIGDVVDIAGAEKSEFALTSDTSGNKLTELEPVQGGTMSVTKTGANMQLQPQVVDALAIGQMTDFMARAAEWEKWEGVLVQVNNVSALSSDACVGTACSDMTLHKFSITGDVLVESALAAMPTPTIARNDCLANVTGVVDYFFDYQILPRTTAEIGTGGSSCPPPETSSALCTDGIDNDGNGFKDCADNTCIAAEATCRTATTINALQTATTLPTGGVELDNVYVMAVSFNKRNFWVSSSLTAAPNEGIYVTTSAVLDAAVVVGAKVNVYGRALEYNDSMGTGTLTEISGYGVQVVAAPATPPVPVTAVDASAMDETYESTLVTLTNVKVTVKGVAQFYVGELQQGTTTFLSDDDILRLTDNVGTCYATITGIWTYQPFDDKYGLLPISKTTGGTCP